MQILTNDACTNAEKSANRDQIINRYKDGTMKGPLRVGIITNMNQYRKRCNHRTSLWKIIYYSTILELTSDNGSTMGQIQEPVKAAKNASRDQCRDNWKQEPMQDPVKARANAGTSESKSQCRDQWKQESKQGPVKARDEYKHGTMQGPLIAGTNSNINQ